MIIRENGIVVGKLDEESLQLTEYTSARLTELIDDWRKNGVDIMQAQEEPLEKGQVCGCVFINVSFEPKAIHIFENELIIEGFEVQPS